MWHYLARRLVQVPFVLLVVSLMTFLITRATPGDPVQIMNQQRSGPLRQMSLAANLAAGIPAGLEGSQQAFIQ